MLVTTKDIIIPAGTELHVGPVASTRWGKDREAIVALGEHHVGYFSIDPHEAIDSGFAEEV